ncbi:MAG: putative toxin-antitoxin system toxin component, PIN family [Burkholderiaceae bacterium]
MLIVFDTDVVVSAMRSPSGASAELLRMVRQGRLQCGVSVALAMEYETVCLRPEHVKAAGISLQDATLYVEAVIAISQPVQVHFRWRPQLRDPSDEMVLEAAVNAQAAALLTFNLRHFQAAAKTFGLKVQRPGEFLRSIP